MARVVVSGYMIRHPVAGNLFAFFHYVLGLSRLGHDVIYIEERGWEGSCYDPVARQHGDDPSRGLEATRRLFAEHGVPAHIAFFDGEAERSYGCSIQELREALATADILLDVGGSCWHREFERCRRRVLIDLDPLFTQLGRYGGHKLEQYDLHYTVGGNIGQPGCPIPTAGVNWLPTVPPVVSDLWCDVPAATESNIWNTVTNWHSYEPIAFKGEKYGQKDVEFLRLLELPAHTSESLELAIAGGGPHPKLRLRESGWRVSDASEISLDVPTYQRYVASARGEFSAAKHAYVATGSGWFSDRSVCYLAAGRPVVLQDTGFSRWLETGRGVMSFTDLEGAASALEDVASAYATHAGAARDIADRVFDYANVLPPIITAALDLDGAARNQTLNSENRA